MGYFKHIWGRNPYLVDGYEIKYPDTKVDEVEVTKMRCPHCQMRCEYVPYMKGTSYIATAECSSCGWIGEF